MEEGTNMKRYRTIGLTAFLVLSAFAAGMVVSARLGVVGDLAAAVGKAPEKTEGIIGPSPGANPFVQIAKDISPAVVNISTTRTIKNSGKQMLRQLPGHGPEDFFGGEDFFDRFFGEMPDQNLKQSSLGSGFIIDKDGYILTNNHVVDKADDIKVTLNSGKEYHAEVVGRDASTDITLIKIKDGGELTATPLGDSDRLEVGEWVVAIGNPFGLKHTVTVGVVSAKGRTIGAGPYDDFIQTDASINPGNSGGPLINIRGEVIGINTAINAAGQGIGFAIPINLARKIYQELKESGKVTRGWLGVGIQPLNDDLARKFGLKDTKGALVGNVIKGNPAEQAGIKAGDVIVEYDGKPVESDRDVVSLVGATAVGREVAVKVIRNGKEQVLHVKVAKKSEAGSSEEEEEPAVSGEDKLGLSVQDLTGDLAKKLGLEETAGVLVAAVTGGSPAGEGGVRRGDVIVEVNRQPVADVRQFRSALGKVGEDAVILLLVNRQGGTLFLTIKVK
jgi:serine protease Do